MIRFRKQNALQPEKDTEISLNFTPFIFFGVGYMLMDSLIANLRRL